MHFPRSVNKAVRRPRSLERSIGPEHDQREIRRNSKDRTGRVYRPTLADDYARWRRSRSRRNQRFTPDYWAVVVAHLKKEWSPEQISAGCGESDGCPSAMRRSIATSGRIDEGAELCISTFAGHKSKDVNATVAMTVEAVSRASG